MLQSFNDASKTANIAGGFRLDAPKNYLQPPALLGAGRVTQGLAHRRLGALSDLNQFPLRGFTLAEGIAVEVANQAFNAHWTDSLCGAYALST
jgi:hypothetical protein